MWRHSKNIYCKGLETANHQSPPVVKGCFRATNESQRILVDETMKQEISVTVHLVSFGFVWLCSSWTPCIPLPSSARYAPNFSGGPSGPRARNFSAARRLLGLQSGIHLCNHSGAARRAEPTRTNICVTDLCFLQTSSDPLRVFVFAVFCLCRAPQKRAGS